MLIADLCYPYLRQPQLLPSLPATGTVWGIAYLNEKLHVICEKSADVCIYNATSPGYPFLKKVQIKQLKRARDIAACYDNELIYIAADSCVWRLAAAYENISIFAPNNDSPDTIFPWSISVSEGRLLVTPKEGNELFVYLPHGALLRRVVLPSFMRALHAVEGFGGSFVICHIGYRERRRQHHQITIVDQAGRVMGFYGDRSGSEQHQLNKPYYLARGEDGKIFAADFNNDRVLLFDADLNLECVIPASNKPRRLCFVPEFGQLIIGQLDSSLIELYRLVANAS